MRQTEEKPYLVLEYVPYAVDVDKALRTITVKGCQNSLLGKMDNRQQATGNRFSTLNRNIHLSTGTWVEVSFVDNDVSFLFNRPIGKATFLRLTDWIRGNEDAIRSIGYEVLEKDPR